MFLLDKTETWYLKWKYRDLEFISVFDLMLEKALAHLLNETNKMLEEAK